MYVCMYVYVKEEKYNNNNNNKRKKLRVLFLR